MYAAISHQLDVTAAEPASQATGGANPPDQSARRALESILQELGPLQAHFIDVTAEDVKSRIREDENFARLIQEGREGKWSAALVTEDPSDRWSIEQRFDSMADMKAFLRERNAVVEVWLYGESGPEGHRLTAHEVAKWSTEDEAPPSYMTATFIDRDGRTPTRRRLEYGIGAADETLSSALAYQRHRDLQHELRRILRSRDADGNLSARAQLEALDRAQRIGTIDIKRMPAPSDDDRDLLLAFECRTALNGQITEVLR